MPGMSPLCRNIAVVKFPGRTFFLAVNSFDRRSDLLATPTDALPRPVDLALPLSHREIGERRWVLHFFIKVEVPTPYDGLLDGAADDLASRGCPI
jgi:hypothetical protein